MFVNRNSTAVVGNLNRFTNFGNQHVFRRHTHTLRQCGMLIKMFLLTVYGNKISGLYNTEHKLELFSAGVS